MSPSRLLITGVNGRIGTILRSALANTYDLYGLDREGPFSERVLAADIAGYDPVARVVEQFSPLDCIVHLAADPRVTAGWEAVLSANIIGTRNVFEAARVFRVPRLIFASSSHVTGAYEGFAPNLALHTQTEPPKISARDPIRPDSDYGVSKAFGETLARYYCARWGMDAICLRIGAVLADDDPTRDPRHRKIWLSHRDLVQLVERSLAANVTFGIYYGVSNNKGAFWDISNARSELGYAPVDDASTR
ncbi:MAG TPA: NAD(P)-dependent oxidoreductase [Anaerolineales bacterium]|nr:NAD(P)-dependent oxidoreductase [Anaerolineales bacterium]